MTEKTFKLKNPETPGANLRNMGCDESFLNDYLGMESFWTQPFQYKNLILWNHIYGSTFITCFFFSLQKTAFGKIKEWKVNQIFQRIFWSLEEHQLEFYQRTTSIGIKCSETKKINKKQDLFLLSQICYSFCLTIHYFSEPLFFLSVERTFLLNKGAAGPNNQLENCSPHELQFLLIWHISSNCGTGLYSLVLTVKSYQQAKQH